MNLCDDGHEEVCYDSRHCPVCEIIKDNKDLTERLTDELKELATLATSLEEQNNEYLAIFAEVKSAYPEFAI